MTSEDKKEMVLNTPQSLTQEQQAQARENIGIINDPNCHAAFFDIDYSGTISLKSEYAKDGSKADELLEDIILPEIVNKTAVIGLADSMFKDDWRVKSIAFPSTVDIIPIEFCNGAGALRNISNTEHITAVRDKAFRNTGIGKAIFPNLKELGEGAFIQCVLLSVVDIGNTITEIPATCFVSCKSLSAVKGGASVKTVKSIAFMFTYNLTSAPFIANVTKMEDSAFQNSRIQYDWNSLNCEFGTCSTPIQDNTTDYWGDYTPVPCENRLVTMLCQQDPRWANEYWGTVTAETAGAYGDRQKYAFGCSPMTILHIHSAFTGKKYATPKEFEAEISQLPNGASWLSNMPKTTAKIAELLEALGYKVTTYTGTITADIYRNVCEKLKAGAYVSLAVGVSASNPDGGHAVVLYGINKYGEVLALDSDNGNHYVGVYDDFFTYAAPFQNMTGPSSDIIIVEKV